MIIKLFKLVFIIALISNPLMAKNQYFKEGLDLFENKKFKKAKFKFEQDVVYNPKNELSYLYLSKIFKNLNKKDLQEHNLNTVILLNPKNDEAIYYLALINIKKSNFSKAKELISTLENVCDKYCDQKEKLEDQLKNSLKQ